MEKEKRLQLDFNPRVKKELRREREKERERDVWKLNRDEWLIGKWKMEKAVKMLVDRIDFELDLFDITRSNCKDVILD